MNEHPEAPLRDHLPRAGDPSRDARIHAAAREAFVRAHRDGPTSAIALVQSHGVSFVFVSVAVLTVVWATMTASGVGSLYSGSH